MVWFLLIAYVLFTFGVSYLNAWGVGRNWTETRIAGGWPRIVNGAGAIMAACGFTWVYFIIFAFIFGAFGVFTVSEVQAFLEAGYLLILLPILGSGLIITVESWARAWKERDLPNLAVAAWNTYAQIHNTYNAISGFGDAFGHLGDVLASMAKGKDGAKVFAFILLVLFTVGLGIMTTALIIWKEASNDPLRERASA